MMGSEMLYQARMQSTKLGICFWAWGTAGRNKDLIMSHDIYLARPVVHSEKLLQWSPKAFTDDGLCDALCVWVLL